MCIVVEVRNISHRGYCLSKCNTNEAWYKAVCGEMVVGQKVTDQESVRYNRGMSCTELGDTGQYLEGIRNRMKSV